MRVLIVEDEKALLDSISGELRAQSYAVDQAEDGEDGLYKCLEYPVDLAVVDLGLPKLDGIELIKRTRAAGKTYPIIVLTARGRWQEKVDGLEAGADDYLTKPFEPEELYARIRALIRRSHGQTNSELSYGKYALNLSSQAFFMDKQQIELTAYEYKVVQYLMLNAGKVVSKSELTEHLYEDDQDKDSNVLEVFVGRLRKKLDPDGDIVPIETLRGRGYRWACGVEQ